MKKFILAAFLALYSSISLATITLTWTPGEAVQGAAVSEWLIWCIPADRTYGNPSISPGEDLSAVFEWQEQDGLWKCKVNSRSAESGTDSPDAADGSNEIFYCVRDKAKDLEADPDNNCEVAVTPLPPTFPNSPTLAVE
jgi:hypothetical protein